MSTNVFVFLIWQNGLKVSAKSVIVCCCSSSSNVSHLFQPTMTGNLSFPSDRWRWATIKQEQDSLSQPKPHRDGLIVCSGPPGIAYLIAAITNCYHRDRWDLLLTFSEWILLRTVLWERHAEMRNKVDDSSEREQIGCSLLESQKWLQLLANAFMLHNLGQICHWLRLTLLLYRGPRLVCVPVSGRKQLHCWFTMDD